MRIKKFLIFFLLAVFLLSPLAGLAQFKLQQTYPSAGGSQLTQETTASKSIPALVKYLFNLTVWVCILVAIIVLIAGGVQYVASTGDVSKMTGAKTRIYGSLLGLTILIGAWFVLHTMNPSLVIPKISYIPIKQGIILFTKEGYDQIETAPDESIMSDLLQRKDAFRLNYSLPDLTKEFGELVVYPDIAEGKLNLNFENFELYAIGFWGSRENNSIVAFYPQKDYSITLVKYFSAIGEVDKEGKPLAIPRPSDSNPKIKGMKYIKLFSDVDAYFSNPVEYFYVNKYSPKDHNDKTILNPILIYSDQREAELVKNPLVVSTKSHTHSPLSLKIIRNGPGVYLLADNGDERYFDSSAKDLSDPSINFDQMAQDIKIINDTPERKYTDEDGITHTIPGETRDFLAILHQDDNFSGKLKVYFEQRMYTDSGKIKSSKTSAKALIPAYRFDGSPILSSALISTATAKNNNLFTFNENISKTDVDLSSILSKNGNFSSWKTYNFGNLPMKQFDGEGKMITAPDGSGAILRMPIIPTKQDVDYDQNLTSYGVTESSRYGVLSKPPSSVEVFELSQNPGASGECQEVKICTEKSGKGYCLAYTSENNKTNTANTAYYPMPWYLFVRLPSANHEGGTLTDMPVFEYADGRKHAQEFANNIKSIIIQPEGRCAVVLAGGMVSPDWWKAWNFPVFISKWGLSDSRNDVFTTSDYNLEDNQIGMCGSSPGFGRFYNQSCAVDITVYPIK